MNVRWTRVLENLITNAIDVFLHLPVRILQCVSTIFLQHPDECSLDSSTWESNYKFNWYCYFDVFLHLPVGILHIYFCVKIQEKKRWVVVALMEDPVRFLGAQVWQLFFNYLAMTWFLQFSLGCPNKIKICLQLYIYGMVSAFSRCPNWKKKELGMDWNINLRYSDLAIEIARA